MIYVVLYVWDGERDINGVFDTREAAEAFIKEKGYGSKKTWKIEEHLLTGDVWTCLSK
jgi:hypothetical protein